MSCDVVLVPGFINAYMNILMHVFSTQNPAAAYDSTTAKTNDVEGGNHDLLPTCDSETKTTSATTRSNKLHQSLGCLNGED